MLAMPTIKINDREFDIEKRPSEAHQQIDVLVATEAKLRELQLHTENPYGLHAAVSTPPDIDWSMLLEPSDSSDVPAEIILKAVGLPDTGDHACNLLLIG